MILARTLLSLFVALSIAFGPFGAAMAAGQGGQGQMTGHQGGAMHGMTELDHAGAHHAADMAAMEDCDQGQPSSSDCKCCDTKAKCPGSACLMTCCKVIGVVRSTLLVRLFEPVRYRPIDPLKPPDWAAQPPGPPPRF